MGYKANQVYNRPESLADTVARRKQHFNFQQAQQEFYAERAKNQKEIMNALDKLCRSL